MMLPSSWMEPKADGEGPEIIEITDTPGTAMATNLAHAYDDSDSDPPRAQKPTPKRKSRASSKRADESETESEDSKGAGDSEQSDSSMSTSSGAGRARKIPASPSASTAVHLRPGLANTVFVGALNFSTTERHLTQAFGGAEKVPPVLYTCVCMCVCIFFVAEKVPRVLGCTSMRMCLTWQTGRIVDTYYVTSNVHEST